jgi:nitrogen PTS system EIIA component
MMPSQTIATLLSAKRVLLNEKATNQKILLEKASLVLSKDIPFINNQDILSALIEREKLGSTAIGAGIAIPHARIPKLKTPIACLIRLIDGIAFDALDEKEVSVFFVLLVPEEAASEHLQLLAKLAKALKNPDLCDILYTSNSSLNLIEALREEAKLPSS